MPVSFSHVPANWRMPLYWVELDPSKAGLPTFQGRSLLVGIMNTASASAMANVPVPVASQAQADALFGQGSMLAMMFRTFYANNFANEVWGLPVAEPAGAAATGTIVVASPATGSGTIALYIAGMLVPVPVSAGDVVGVIATSIVTAITNNKDLPVTATATTGTVTVTGKWKGTLGNEISLMHSYYGTVGGEQLPPGVALTFTQPINGTGDPIFTTAISNLGETEVDYVCMPFVDSTSMLAWETEFGFSDTGRWGFIRQHYGQIFNAKSDTHANLLTLAATRKSTPMSVMAVEAASPTPSYQWAAAYCAKAARALLNDPARPLQTLSLDGCLPAQGQNRFLLSELNAQAYGGLQRLGRLAR